MALSGIGSNYNVYESAYTSQKNEIAKKTETKAEAKETPAAQKEEEQERLEKLREKNSGVEGYVVMQKDKPEDAYYPKFDGMGQISETENKYCALCGSRIKADGSCPICIIPTFISGNKQSHNQNVSHTNSSKQAMLPRNSRVGGKA